MANFLLSQSLASRRSNYSEAASFNATIASDSSITARAVIETAHASFDVTK
jgi:hypothetical protein